jgi:hypothetical protein
MLSAVSHCMHVQASCTACMLRHRALQVLQPNIAALAVATRTHACADPNVMGPIRLGTLDSLSKSAPCHRVAHERVVFQMYRHGTTDMDSCEMRNQIVVLM